MNWTAWIVNALKNLNVSGSPAGVVVTGTVGKNALYEYAVMLADAVTEGVGTMRMIDDKDRLSLFILEICGEGKKGKFPDVYVMNGDLVDGRACCEDCNVSALKAVKQSGKIFILYHEGGDCTGESVVAYCQLHVFLWQELNRVFGNLKIRIREADKVLFESPEVVTMRGEQFVRNYGTSVRYLVHEEQEKIEEVNKSNDRNK